MKFLLTGGAGYIGSACLRWLLRHGHDPVAYDNLSAGHAAAVPGGRLEIGDILDTPHLTDVLRRGHFDGVMHFAALASVPESIAEPDRYYRINTTGTQSVLDAMRAAGIWRFVFSSTAATYGFRAEMPLTEDAPLIPETPYGSTKLCAEWMIREYARAYGVGYAALRYFNASGADEDGCHGEHRNHETHLIPLTLAGALHPDRELSVFGSDYDTPDGTCVRDYVHVLDLAEAHRLAIESLERGKGGVYNVGVGIGVSVLEIVQTCQTISGCPIPYTIKPRRPGDPAVLVASAKRISDRLGWHPRFSDIGTIIRTAWQWHQRHPHGYRDTEQIACTDTLSRG